MRSLHLSQVHHVCLLDLTNRQGSLLALSWRQEAASPVHMHAFGLHTHVKISENMIRAVSL